MCKENENSVLLTILDLALPVSVEGFVDIDSMYIFALVVTYTAVRL
jgi:hypothetical protein